MELRQSFESVDDRGVVDVMADDQINHETRRFIDSPGLRERVRFAVDPGRQAIEELGILRENPEPIEAGVPHPATCLIDRDGVVRCIDERFDFQIWLGSDFVRKVVARIDFGYADRLRAGDRPLEALHAAAIRGTGCGAGGPT